MPKMNAKAADLTDPIDLLDRIEYRNKRMDERLHEHMDDPQKFIKLMAGFNASDLRRLRELLAA